MWLVYDSEEKLYIVTDDYEEAKSEYERLKESWKDYVSKYGEFSGDERVILAKIEKDFYPYETHKKTPEGDNYWDWKEEIY
jgi:hypothetical protein